MSENLKGIRVEFSMTINLGNFNSAKLGCVLEDRITPSENFEDKFNELYIQIRRKVREELSKLVIKNS